MQSRNKSQDDKLLKAILFDYSMQYGLKKLLKVLVNTVDILQAVCYNNKNEHKKI
jgi:hypothetical protein